MSPATFQTGSLTWDGSNFQGPGAFIGNGKVGAVISGASNLIGADSCLITYALDSPKGKYQGNTIETFNPFSFEIGPGPTGSNSASASASAFVLSNQVLHMDYGMLTVNGSVALDEGAIGVSTDMYCPQNLPFCFVQTIRLGGGGGEGEVQFRHNISAPANIRDPEFNNNVVFNGQTNQPIYILTAQGYLTGGRQIVSASTYVFGGAHENLGFNVPVYEPNTCFNLFNVGVGGIGGGGSTISIITATMTSEDFDGPMEEAKRIVLSVLNAGGVANVRKNHVLAWSNIWKSGVEVIGKSGISAADAAGILGYQAALKTALYGIYSCVRAGVNLDVNPSVLGFMDRSGQGLYTGDLNLVPCLLLLKPEFARAILDYRYKTLALASKLAAGYGFSGAKYPYEDDRLGYKNALYWTTTSTMTVFNTAAISINVWNYYRVVQDLDWLRSVGYPVLRGNATFFASLVVGGAGEGGGGGGGCECGWDGSRARVHIENVVGVAGLASARDNVFTNALVKLALRFAVEASYELSLAVPQEWIDYYYALDIPATPNEASALAGPILKVDAATPASTGLVIPEPLVAFVPYFADKKARWNSELGENLKAYETTSQNPVAEWIVGTLRGVQAQADPLFVGQFAASLDQYVAPGGANRGSGATWGAFTDNGVAAMLVLMVAQGIGAFNIVGGVAETRFYYAELGLSSKISANMPPAWDRLKIGANGKTLITQNVLYYV